MNNESRRIDIQDLPEDARAGLTADDIQDDTADAGDVQGGIRVGIRAGIRVGKRTGIRALRDVKGIRSVDAGDSWLLK